MTEKQEVCPHCGYCPTCGRSNRYYDRWYRYPHYPWDYRYGTTINSTNYQTYTDSNTSNEVECKH